MKRSRQMGRLALIRWLILSTVAALVLGVGVPPASASHRGGVAANTVAPSSLPTFPLIGSNNSGGDQSYGQATTTGFTSYSAAGPSTDAYNDTQIIGRSDWAVAVNGTFESWGQSASGRTKFDLVKTIKGKGTYPNVISSSRTAYVTLYFLLESLQNLSSGAGYQTYINLVRANDWWLYSLPGGSGGGGTIVSSTASGAGFYNLNYAYAYPSAAGTVAAGSSIVGHAYGSLSSGQGPAQAGAAYAAYFLLTTDRSDSRFSGLAVNGAASNADGVHFDNAFSFPGGGGNLADSTDSWDGQGQQTNNSVASQASGGASPLLAQGQAVFFSTLNLILASKNPGITYGHSINFGSYANTRNYGDVKTATANAMTGVVQAGMLEAVGGVSGYGWQSYMTAAEILTNIDYGISQLAAPARIAMMYRVPGLTDGSTAWLRNGPNPTGITISSGSTQEYQENRCFMALAFMKNAYATPVNNGYNYAQVRWYDEAGDDSLTQVDQPRGWLGNPVAAYQTITTGVLGRQFDNGAVLFADWANSGTTTVTSSMLMTAFGHTYKFIHGTQQSTINSGASFSSYTMQSCDGLFLKKVS